MNEVVDRERHQISGFGARLRSCRESRGISLIEIADATKISRRFLEAIEEENLEILPAPVFTRGFVREHARYLGLDPDEVVAQYRDAISMAEGEPEEADNPRKDGRRIPGPLARIDRNVLAFVLLLIPLVAVALWVWNENDRSEKSETVKSRPVPAQVMPVASPPVAESTASAPSSSREMTMVLVAMEATWLDLFVDGKPVIYGRIEAGQQREIVAMDRFEFRTIGNSGGLTLIFEGVTLPPLGPKGKTVRDQVFDRSTLARLKEALP